MQVLGPGIVRACVMCEVGALSIDAPSWHRRSASGVALPLVVLHAQTQPVLSFCLCKGLRALSKSLLPLNKGKISVRYFPGWQAASTMCSLKLTFPQTLWAHQLLEPASPGLHEILHQTINCSVDSSPAWFVWSPHFMFSIETDYQDLMTSCY